MGEKITMDGEKAPYKIMARDDRYVILCRPFNLKRTYTYSIVDLEEKVRGPCNYVFGPLVDFNTEDGAKENLAMLRSGKQEVSRRRSKDLSDREIALLSSTGPT